MTKAKELIDTVNESVAAITQVVRDKNEEFQSPPVGSLGGLGQIPLTAKLKRLRSKESRVGVCL